MTLRLKAFWHTAQLFPLRRTADALMNQGALSVGTDFWIAERLQGLGAKSDSLNGYPWKSFFTRTPTFQQNLWKYTEDNFNPNIFAKAAINYSERILSRKNFLGKK